MFTSKEDRHKGARVLYKQFRELGLQEHTGRDGGKSKTEAIYIPPRLRNKAYETINLDEKLEVVDGSLRWQGVSGI
jgi:hypothetical protein